MSTPRFPRCWRSIAIAVAFSSFAAAAYAATPLEPIEMERLQKKDAPDPSHEPVGIVTDLRARHLLGDWPPETKRITLELDRARTREALKRLAAQAGWGLSLEGKPGGRVDMVFAEVPADEALLSILVQHNLSAERRGSMVTIRASGEDFDEESGTHRHSGVTIGSDVKVAEGETVSEAVSVFGDVHVDGTVLQDAVSVGGTVLLGPKAMVKGSAVSVGGGLQIDPSAVVKGDRVSVGLGFPFSSAAASLPHSFGRFGARKLGVRLVDYAVFFVLGLLLLSFAPGRLKAVGRELARAPGLCVGVGFAGALAVPVLVALLVVTLVGIVLVPVVVLLVIFALVVGFTALALELGGRIPALRSKGSQVAMLAAGFGVFFLIGLVPWLGFLILWGMSILVFGAVLRTRFGSAGQNANVAPLP